MSEFGELSKKSLTQIIMGIKDCMMTYFGPHISKVSGPDGRKLVEYLEALALHLVPVIERLLTTAPAAAEHHEMLRVLQAKVAELDAHVAAIKAEMVAPSPDAKSRPRSWPWDHKRKA